MCAQHVFGRPRLVENAFTANTDTATLSSRPFQELPPPTRPAPFRLDLSEILPPEHMEAIERAQKLVFHFNGDVGGIKDPVPQQLVANGMERDFRNDPAEDPAFLYLLGDCVYFNGQASEYFAQFYQPYEHYLAPIFAVPGNHDGDAVPPESSLDAFVRNFCSDAAVVTPEAGESTRTAMTQPNVFWTLLTPFATIIGLYTNVPEGGSVHPDQLNWLIGELQDAPQDRPVFVTMHHPVYSLDDHHSRSLAMQRATETAFQRAGRFADVVVAGHVHDYQRFTRRVDNREVPYIVAGGGGYHNLHRLVRPNGQKIIPPVRVVDPQDNLVLENYVDSRFGFLRIEVTPELVQGKYFTVARPQESWSDPPELADVFELDWRAHNVLQNSLPRRRVTFDSSISGVRSR